MKTFAELEVFSKQEINLLHAARSLFEAMPDLTFDFAYQNGEKVHTNCHMLARGFNAVFPETLLVDGHVCRNIWHSSFESIEEAYVYFLWPGHVPGAPHSWLRLLNRQILDIYPWATVGGPILVDQQHVIHPYYGMYRPIQHHDCSEGWHGTFDIFSDPSFWRATDRVVDICIETHALLGLNSVFGVR